MKYLFDVNLLIAATFENHVHHGVVVDFLNHMNSNDRFVVCRATQQSFLRLLTQRIVPGFDPLTNNKTIKLYSKLMEDALAVYANEPKGLEQYWPGLAARTTASPKLWMDAYLTSFALAASMTLASLDKAFVQFESKGLMLKLL